MKDPNTTEPPSRRVWLQRGAASLAWVGSAGAPARADTSARRAAPLDLTAQTTEGPYFVAGMPLRSDITEGRRGVPMEVRITVVDAQGLALPGLRVDLWHCDAQGLYAGFAGQGDDGQADLVGQTFLRGAQVSADDGVVAFLSLYPGWYAGRTTHVHLKVSDGSRHLLTSQFFLPDALSEYLYTALTAYRRRVLRGVLNSMDGIALSAGPSTVGSVREAADRYVASLLVVVDPRVTAAVHRPGPGSGPPPEALRAGNTRRGPPPGFGGTPALPTPEGLARELAIVPGPTTKP